MTDTPLDTSNLTRLRHQFTVEPVTPARMKLLQGRSHPGAYDDEPVPDHIKSAVSEIAHDTGMVQLSGPKEQIWMPTPVARPNWFSMSRGYSQRMLSKYTLKDFVEIERGDSVVDCGAFVGGFALAAARKTGPKGRVIAVEPAPINFECLTRNTQDTEITNINAGLFDTAGQIEFIVRANATDNSMLTEESGQEISRHSVPTLTLRDLIAQQNLPHIDFLKLEAEGVELEILAHAHPETVRKIAIDAGPERYGQSPLLDIAVMLAQRGYRLANRNYWLYATAT
ncbi:MAG: FkbM family methyltransferase [Paracoccaceae bacterium]